MSKVFADGMRVDKPQEKSPTYVIAKVSFKSDDFKKFLDANTNERGWCNVDILESQKGVYYATLNEYKADMTKPSFLSKDAVEDIQRAREAHNEGIKYPDEISANQIPF